MKKQHLFSLIFLTLSLSVHAQIPVELKLNPFGIIRSTPDLALEIIVNDNIGIEPKIGFHSVPTFTISDEEFSGSGVAAGVWGKYYAIPNDFNGGDGFFAGAYARYSNLTMTSSLVEETGNWIRTSIGVQGGYKWVGNKGLVIEGGIGLGVAAVNRFRVEDRSINLQAVPLLGWLDLPVVLTIGYRFNNG